MSHIIRAAGANSLLDIVVFGRACANRINEICKPGDTQADLPLGAGEASIASLDRLRWSKGPKSTAEIRGELQGAMQKYAAVFRIQDKLEEGCEKVTEVCKSFDDVGISDRSMVWNTDLVRTYRTRTAHAWHTRGIVAHA